ncbi:MAG: response regulator [Thermodesulfovibrionales bacterium]|nr:response regulator [Thermodesulfovibrionales bacterium]
MATKVLLADDSITIQKVVELILTEHGFEVKTVNNGQEALTTMLSYTPDIVLADAEMPVLNGYQLCERIKNNSRTKHIPVILLAGAFEPIDVELVKNVKADGTLTKPFEAQELLSKINSFLGRKEKKMEEELIEEPSPVTALTEESEEAIMVEEEIWEVEEPAEQITIEESPEVITQPEQKIVPLTEERSFTVEEKTAIPEQPLTGISKESFERAIRDAVAGIIASSDLPSIIRAAVKDSVEKMLAERLPYLIEDLTKELLKGSLSGISSEIEKVLWETLPELAETLITKEIERIKVSLS